MAPIRRYLRITKYSVLECRIYLDNPALAQSWLLNPRDPVLPRVIESVRPLVLPKLREEKERERSRKKGKKRSIKDVVVEDDFEVSIFLTETDTRHSLLHKQKLFRDKVQTRLTSNSSRLLGAAGMGASRDEPIDVERQFPQGGGAAPAAAAAAAAAEDERDDGEGVPVLLREEEDDAINLADIPAVGETAGGGEFADGKRPKRRRRQGPEDADERSDADVIETDSSGDDGLFVDEDEDEDDDGVRSDKEGDDAASGRRPAKRLRRGDAATGGDTAGRGDGDDKKKMAMDISYEGFAIYGRVLCLVVKRRGGGPAGPSGSNKPQPGRPGGQAMMENWIASTQLPAEAAAGEAEGP
ncbi:adb89a0c-e759-4503-9b15-b69c404539c8 [Thermothielavioides terrestris]|uniref:Adb89a0c-e759-4503-9b15-b69c404539c8 n=1 Tax=Thermothielavioides terrestris TaxID=2587410 RepID=A0A3S4AHW0_9PEZI|nr:adb89a0c-e759-4503-9b15-b69c404539c8 [Thermothielavioides terrestris]